MIWHILIGVVIGALAGFIVACIFLAPPLTEIDALRASIHKLTAENARLRKDIDYLHLAWLEQQTERKEHDYDT